MVESVVVWCPAIFGQKRVQLLQNNKLAVFLKKWISEKMRIDLGVWLLASRTKSVIRMKTYCTNTMFFKRFWHSAMGGYTINIPFILENSPMAKHPNLLKKQSVYNNVSFVLQNKILISPISSQIDTHLLKYTFSKTKLLRCFARSGLILDPKQPKLNKNNFTG